MVLTCVGFAACSDDDDDEPGGGDKHSLTGRWVSQGVYSVENPNVLVPTSPSQYIFNEDGTGEYVGTGHRIYVFDDYKVENNSLYILWEGDSEYDYEGAIKWLGGNMLLSWGEESSPESGPWCLFVPSFWP